MERRLARALPKLPKLRIQANPQAKLKVEHRTRRKDFLAAVNRIKEYITAGDIFQAVLSQRLDVEPGVDPFSIYRALRIVNPSPYMYFLRCILDEQPAGRGKKKKAPRTVHVVGSSPEVLVRVTQGKVEYRPIAGTRRRSGNEAEDLSFEAEMMADEKERAEHVMLVDLGRNDVGRVSEYGSVKVDRLMFVERYSHVMHMVSAISGKLRKGLTAVDAFRACFPAGTLSGAP
jgi:anthranilate synthase component 1